VGRVTSPAREQGLRRPHGARMSILSCGNIPAAEKGAGVTSLAGGCRRRATPRLAGARGSERMLFERRRTETVRPWSEVPDNNALHLTSGGLFLEVARAARAHLN
jgi:hypothetical protein